MTKKDFEAAARIVQETRKRAFPDQAWAVALLEHGFAELFRDDNPRFDEARFRAACIPGANVRARPRKGSE